MLLRVIARSKATKQSVEKNVYVISPFIGYLKPYDLDSIHIRNIKVANLTCKSSFYLSKSLILQVGIFLVPDYFGRQCFLTIIHIDSYN